MSVKRAPRVKLSWTASGLTTSFGGYNVYRRPIRLPAAAWSKIGAVTVPTGYTAANVESYHNSFYDYEAGWALTSGQWATGWEYAFTNVNATTGVEAPITVGATSVVVTADDNPWLVNNASPWLNFPLKYANTMGTTDASNIVTSGMMANRDLAVTRTRYELPYRTATIGWVDPARLGQDNMRAYRGAQALGQAMCLHTQWDRVIGALGPITRADMVDQLGDMEYTGTILESYRDGAYQVADFNAPAGMVLDGASQFASTTSATSLNPTGAFTIVMAGVFPSTNGAVHLSKGNVSSSTSYGLYNSSGANLTFYLNGASGSGSVTNASAGVTDGKVHVVIATSSGTAQTVYYDGTAQSTTGSITTGAISNSTALVAGANNAGAAGWSALAPLQSWGYFGRVLSTTEITALTDYLLGYASSRPPVAAAAFYDLRDTRCWSGYQTSLADLSGNGLNATVTASPVTRGIPWNLKLLDRF